jgi:hypothetical protein
MGLRSQVLNPCIKISPPHNEIFKDCETVIVIINRGKRKKKKKVEVLLE